MKTLAGKLAAPVLVASNMFTRFASGPVNASES